MSLASALAIYFIIWWLMLFLVLPFGIRNAHESGEAVEEGNEPGAPVKPRLIQKAVITTILAALVFAVFYLAVTRGLLSLDSLPFYNTMPSPLGALKKGEAFASPFLSQLAFHFPVNP